MASENANEKPPVNDTASATPAETPAAPEPTVAPAETPAAPEPTPAPSETPDAPEPTATPVETPAVPEPTAEPELSDILEKDIEEPEEKSESQAEQKFNPMPSPSPTSEKKDDKEDAHANASGFEASMLALLDQLEKQQNNTPLQDKIMSTLKDSFKKNDEEPTDKKEETSANTQEEGLTPSLDGVTGGAEAETPAETNQNNETVPLPASPEGDPTEALTQKTGQENKPESPQETPSPSAGQDAVAPEAALSKPKGDTNTEHRNQEDVEQTAKDQQQREMENMAIGATVGADPETVEMARKVTGK